LSARAVSADGLHVSARAVSADRLHVSARLGSAAAAYAASATPSTMSRVRPGSTFTPGPIVVATVIERR
jgi:hypothetical protein